MLGTITIQAQVPNVQKLTALRAQAVAAIADDPDCTVVNQTNHMDTSVFTVVGAKDGERVEVQVEAATLEDAHEQAPNDMVVTDVRETT